MHSRPSSAKKTTERSHRVMPSQAYGQKHYDKDKKPINEDVVYQRVWEEGGYWWAEVTLQCGCSGRDWGHTSTSAMSGAIKHARWYHS